MALSTQTKFFNGITIRVILIFATAISYSLLMDYLDFKQLLDDPCPYYQFRSCWDGVEGASGNRDWPRGAYHTHWSSTHYLYFWMNLCLMVIQAIRLIAYCARNISKETGGIKGYK